MSDPRLRRRIQMLAVVAALVATPVLADHLPTDPEADQYTDPAVADLAVTGVTVDEEPQWIEGSAPAPTTVRSTVTNVGGESSRSGAYSVEYEWVDSHGRAQYINGNLEASSDIVEDRTLAAGESHTHSITWHPRSGQVGLGTLRATITPAGADRLESNDRGDSEEFNVAQRDLSAVILGSDTIIRPDETIFFRTELRNDGNVPETVALAPIDMDTAPRDRLSASLDASIVQVPARSTSTVTLFVSHPFDFKQTPFSTDIPLSVDAGYSGPSIVNSPTIARSTDPIPAGYSYQVARDGTGTLFGEPGEEVGASLIVENTGAHDDALKIQVQEGVAEIQQDLWGLAPGQTRLVPITLKIPGPADPGSEQPVTVEVSSSHLPGDPRVVTFPLQASGPAPRFEDLGVQGSELYLGDLVTGTLRVRNTGDEPFPAGAVVEFSSSHGHTDVQPLPVVAPGGSTTVPFSLGPVDVPGEIALEGRLSLAGGEALAAVAERFVRAPDLMVEANSGFSGLPGEKVAYSAEGGAFSLTNEGNAAEDFLVVVDTPNGTVRLLGDPVLRIGPGETRSVAIEHGLPINVTEATPVHLLVTVSGRSGFSWTSETVTGVITPDPPTVVVDPPQAASILQTVAVAIDTRSTSPVAQATVHVRSPQGNVQSFSAVSGSAQVSFSETGTHKVWAAAVDLFGSEGISLERPIHVDAAPPPEVSWDAPPSGGNLTNTTGIDVTVVSEVPIETVQLTVHDVEGEIRKQAGLTLEDGRATFSLEPLPPGHYTVAVAATNSHGVTSTLNAEWTLVAAGSTEKDPIVDQEQWIPTAPVGLSAVLLVAIAAALRITTRGKEDEQ